MPQIKSEEIVDAEIQSNDSRPFRERLIERFKAHEFVRVKNIDDEIFEWQWLPSTEEMILADGDMRPTVGRRFFNEDYSKMFHGNEQYWGIEAGQEEVLLGENAYLFIEGLYKRVTAKRILDKVPVVEKYQARNFNWGDANMQEILIDEIFRGVESPRFNRNAKELRQNQTTTG